jgi:hypothetical protein
MMIVGTHFLVSSAFFGRIPFYLFLYLHFLVPFPMAIGTVGSNLRFS